MQRGECAGIATTDAIGFDPFFPTNNQELAYAITTYCLPCDVRKECDKWATENNIEFGVWGGKKREKIDT